MEIKMKKLFLIFILLLFIATPAFSEDIVNENSDDTTEERLDSLFRLFSGR